MSDETPECPKCQSSSTYPDGHLLVCAECFHEWTQQKTEEEVPNSRNFLDANGNTLLNGDTVTLIKDLKAGKDTLKTGTKIKNIQLLDEPVNDHDIACKIPGFGSMYLKCSVVKKAK